MTEPADDNVQPPPEPRDEAPPLAASDRLPASLKVVAWFFFATGVLSLVNMGLQTSIRDYLTLNYRPTLSYCVMCISAGLAHRYYILGILVGPALLRRRSMWLQIARAYNVFLMVLLLFGLAWMFVHFFVMYDIRSRPGRSLRDVVSDYWFDYALMTAFRIGVLMYLAWQHRVLARRGVRELFQPGVSKSQGATKRFQFSLATLLMLAALVAAILPSLMQIDVVRQRRTWSSHSRSGSNCQISVACRSHRLLRTPDELEYVLFVTDGRQPADQLDEVYSFRNEHRASDAWAILEMPDGAEVTLNSDCQLFECLDGRFRGSPGQVTKTQLDAFVRSNPAEYTIDALLEFARTHPE